MIISVDTDFARCKVTRRSTSGGLAVYGRHCLRHWSTTQTTIALSSGEAELGGMCKGASHAPGLRAICLDLGLDRGIVMRTDATAAIGMSRRLGVGKIRNLDASLLWLQQKVRSNEVPLENVLGSVNPVDALAKNLMGPS